MLAEPELEQDADETRCITWLNLSGDVTLTWQEQNDERVKELVRKKMAEGFSFFTMRKVVVDTVKVKRKIGVKGVDTIDNLVIADDTFEKMVKGLDDRDLANALKVGTATLAKRRDSSRNHGTVKRLNSPEEVIKAKQALAMRPIVGG